MRNWDDTFMEVAEVFAKRSTCIRLHVGAILVKDNFMISDGYNGVPSGMEHCDKVFANITCQNVARKIPSL